MLTSEQAKTAMRAHGMRITPQRVAVLSYLEDNRNHPTAEDVAACVQQDMPNVAVSTVYNILHELADIGLVNKINVEGVMHFDPCCLDHAHLLCKSCGKITDIMLPEELDDKLKALVKKAKARVDHYSVDIVGLCPMCANKKDSK